MKSSIKVLVLLLAAVFLFGGQSFADPKTPIPSYNYLIRVIDGGNKEFFIIEATSNEGEVQKSLITGANVQVSFANIGYNDITDLFGFVAFNAPLGSQVDIFKGGYKSYSFVLPGLSQEKWFLTYYNVMHEIPISVYLQKFSKVNYDTIHKITPAAPTTTQPLIYIEKITPLTPTSVTTSTTLKRQIRRFN
ncbi:MAG: hypothetical protein KJ732_04660 [Candidatus Margulisbacteria bacterium]|nr:hypothetical protein [Candidatus Margulisiibacteriota bacterium]